MKTRQTGFTYYHYQDNLMKGKTEGNKTIYYWYQRSLLKTRQTGFTYYRYQDSLMKGKTEEK